MSWSVWFTNTTEVNVGVAAGVGRDPDIIAVLVRNTGLGSDRFLVFSTLLAFSLDPFKSRLESLSSLIELGLGALELGLYTLMLGFRRIERTLGRVEVIFGTLKSRLGCIMSFLCGTKLGH